MNWYRKRTELIINSPWLTVERNAYDAAGRHVDDYYILRRDPFVLVVAETESGVLLIRQYRPATDKHYLCVPGGYIHQDEQPLHAAARELEEETGFRAKDYITVGCLDPLPAYIQSSATVVYCHATVQGRVTDPDGEGVDSGVYSWPMVLDKIQSGDIDEMQAVSALLLTYMWRNKNSSKRSGL